MTVTHLPATAGVPRVGFAVPKGVGTAVARNRARRRLRALLDTPEAGLRSGAYLVRLGPAAADLDFAGLRAELYAAVHAAHAAGGPAASAHLGGATP